MLSIAAPVAAITWFEIVLFPPKQIEHTLLKETTLTGRRAGKHKEAEPARDEKEAPFERQFRALETVAAFPRGLSLTELVAVLDLPKTTVHRLLKSLTQAGVLSAKNPRFGPYVLGPRFLGLLQSSVPEDWTESLAKPILRELVDKTGDTCFLARLTGTSIRSVAMATPENDVHVYVVPGRELSPLYGASAKAILAFHDSGTVTAVLASSQVKIPVTKPMIQAFHKELALIRRNNVAFNAGEDIPGYAAVAAPIQLQSLGVQFSIAVTGTYEKLMSPANKTRLIDLTQVFARRLGDAMQIRIAQNSQKAGTEMALNKSE
jgi:DNA-binding IclR family transcriptional regulator